MPRRIVILAGILTLLLAVPALASEFVVSHASSKTVQKQPPAGTCHVRGSFPFNLPDPNCTPGAVNPDVRQTTIARTICRPGYTSTIRPSSHITQQEKAASMSAYGMRQAPSAYEYDHLISLELGGAANDSRNLWPENGGSPNLKDKVENYLHAKVCHGAISLASAQHIIAKDWVHYYSSVVVPPTPPPAQPPTPTTPQPPTATHPSGATGQCVDGTYTYAIHHQGACSHHGGVEQWFN